MTRVTLEASLNVMPLKIRHSFKYGFGTEEKRGNSDQVMTGTQLKGLVCELEMLVDFRVVQTLQYSFGPVTENILIVSQQHIITVQLNNLL